MFDAVAYVKSTSQSIKPIADFLYNEISKCACKFDCKIDKHQKWIVYHEIVTFSFNFYHLILRYRLPDMKTR